MKKNGLNDKKNASFSKILADAMERASRAARVERAARWGTFVLFGGGAGVVALFWRFEQSAATAGRNVAIVLLTALCVGFFIAFKRKSRTRRASASLAARRLERRLGERGEVWVAAVDFSEEETRGLLENGETTSAVLRAATVESAIRGYAEIASTLDEAELWAVLTEIPVDRFRKSGKMRWLCALGVGVNIAICAGAGAWEKWRDVNRPSVYTAEPETVEATIEKEENRENEENKEETKITEKTKVDEDRTIDESKSGTVDEALSWSALELLISELAQNAEIAETLASELERGVGEKGERDGNNATSDFATQALQLARELRANLTRPETGLIAQTRRLTAAAERERSAIETRLGEISRLNALKRSDERSRINGTKEAGEGDERRRKARITGREIAVLLTSARLIELERRLTAAGGVGDWTALELSRVLRNDSATERKRILSEASARVAEWGTALRREESAARILSESWRFDATSQRETTLINRAQEENRALLARFAGRFVGDFNASTENGEGGDEAKRRFNALWREIEATEEESFVIIENLRKRLQDVAARDFIDFVRRDDGALKELGKWNVNADETAGLALNEMASRRKERWAKIAKDVENNRFGRAAERLENVVASIGDEDWIKESENVLNEEIGRDNRVETSGATESDDLQNEMRFSALATLLTLGVGEKTARKIESRALEQENDALPTKTAPSDALTSKDLETQEKQESEWTSQKDDEVKRDSPWSQKARGERDASTEENKVTAEKIEGEDGLRNVESGEETGGENGATAVGGPSEREVKNFAKPSENKAFNAELPTEARRRLEGTNAPEILPEYEEKIRRYRRRITEERR